MNRYGHKVIGELAFKFLHSPPEAAHAFRSDMGIAVLPEYREDEDGSRLDLLILDFASLLGNRIGFFPGPGRQASARYEYPPGVLLIHKISKIPVFALPLCAFSPFGRFRNNAGLADLPLNRFMCQRFIWFAKNQIPGMPP